MQLIIDLDGTICSEEKTFSRSMAKPLAGAKETLDKLKEQGHTIIIYSARSWNEYEMTIQHNNKNIDTTFRGINENDVIVIGNSIRLKYKKIF